MRALIVAGTPAPLLTACAAETAPQPGLRKSSSGGTPAPGADNPNGEHGSNTPAGPSTAPDPGTTIGSETWADGKRIDKNVNVGAGATVEIAPGGVVTVATGVAITVSGTLKMASPAKHAKLTGTGWTGLVIAKAGTLTADGLDIDGAAAALWTQAGNADAKFSNGVINATTPF